MSRLRVLLAGIAALCLTAVALTPAHADHAELDVRKTKCISFGDSAGACLDVYWHATGGVGITINHVYLRATGGFYESKALACSNVRMWNQNDVIAWRKDGAECDVFKNAAPGHDGMQDLFQPSVEMPQATSATVGWTFSPKLDSEVDPGSQHISITVG